jgi:hypothetical protein
LSFGVPFEGEAHFSSVAVIRVDEVGTDQQQDEISSCEALGDCGIDLCAGRYFPVVPGFDERASAQWRKVFIEFLAQSLVAMRVRQKHAHARHPPTSNGVLHSLPHQQRKDSCKNLSTVPPLNNVSKSHRIQAKFATFCDYSSVGLPY